MIPVNGQVPTGVAVSPDGTRVYVATAFGLDGAEKGTVSVINTTNNNVTATIRVGNNPHGVAVSPDGSLAYVTNTDDDTVSVIYLGSATQAV